MHGASGLRRPERRRRPIGLAELRESCACGCLSRQEGMQRRVPARRTAGALIPPFILRLASLDSRLPGKREQEARERMADIDIAIGYDRDGCDGLLRTTAGHARMIEKDGYGRETWRTSLMGKYLVFLALCLAEGG